QQGRVLVEFDFYEIDSWDTESFTVFINDTPFVTDVFRHGLFDNPPDATPLQTTGPSNLGFSGWQDQTYTYRLLIDTDATSLKLGFGTTLNSGISDESWGIDNVHVFEHYHEGASQLRGDTSIRRAFLRLYPKQVFYGDFTDTAGVISTVELYRLAETNTDWVEGDSNGVIEPGASTFNSRTHPAQPWAGAPGANTPGVDYIDDLLASRQWSDQTPLGEPFDLLITDPSFIQGWLDGSLANTGFLLHVPTQALPAGVENNITFHSSEAVDPTLRPELIIEYGVSVEVPFNTPVPDTIEYVGDVDRYVFDGQEGQIVTVQRLSGDVDLTLLDADGAVVAGAGSNDALLNLLTLPATGLYTLHLEPRGERGPTVSGELDNTGPYSFAVWTPDVDPAPTPIGFGEALTDRLTVRGDIARYSLEVLPEHVGKAVSITVSQVTNIGGLNNYSFGTTLLLIAPDGTTTLASVGTDRGDIRAIQIDDFTLPAAGTYTIEINDAGGDHTGVFTVGVSDQPIEAIPIDTATDTTDGVLTLGDNSSFAAMPDGLIHGSTTLTVEAWFRTLGGGVILGYQNQPPPTGPTHWVPAIYIGGDGHLRGKFWNGSANPITTSSSVTNGEWRHVALVCDVDTQRMYLDGQLVGERSGGINHLDMTFNQIGNGYTSGWPWGNSWFYGFTGEINDVRIWHKALTEQEIADNIAAAPDPASPGLVAAYDMDPPGGSTLIDLTANANDAALVGDVTLGLPSALHADQINPVGDVDQFTFTAQQGEAFNILIDSTTSTLDLDAVVVDTLGATRASGASGNDPDILNFVAPADDTYTVRVETAGGSVHEKLDNTGDYILRFEKIVTSPDLVVSDVALPTAPNVQSGDTIAFGFTVENTGNTATLAPSWLDRAVLSTNAVYGDGDDIELGLFEHTGGLEVGAGYTASVTATIPDGVAGDFFLIVETDANDQVPELFGEVNNVRASVTTFHIVPAQYPDLVVEDLVVAPGQLIDEWLISWNTANRGDADADGGWSERVVVRNLTTGVALVNTTVDVTADLPVGATAANEFAFTAFVPGRYQVRVTTDAGDRFFELNAVGHDDAEQNNTTETRFLIEGPDLVVTDLTGPTELVIGDPAEIELSWTVQNQGPGTGLVGQWVDRVVLSTDNTIGNGDDVTAAEFTHTGLLDANTSYVETQTVTLPGGLTGAFNLYVVTDATNTAPEPDGEDNNTSA
ncbi:MAG: LamG-like jellyroll fold domain-containing protein, partial [Planctomycetota bacterium]